MLACSFFIPSKASRAHQGVPLPFPTVVGVIGRPAHFPLIGGPPLRIGPGGREPHGPLK